MKHIFEWLADDRIASIRRWRMPNEYTTRTMLPVLYANRWNEAFGYVCASAALA
jgi:hypothetical protein